MQPIAELEARASRRADAVEDLERRLAAAEWRLRARQRSPSVDRGGLWARVSAWLKGDGIAAEIARLRTQKVRADAALKIAVDELHQAHVAALRVSPWSRTLVRPAEAALQGANAEYHPWDRVVMFGSQAIDALREARGQGAANIGDAVRLAMMALTRSSGPSGSLNEELATMHRAGEAVDRFVKAVDLLARDRPRPDLPRVSDDLRKCARRLMAVGNRFTMVGVQVSIPPAAAEIRAILNRILAESGGERGDVDAARTRLEGANQQVIAMAWSKIPARLRPKG